MSWKDVSTTKRTRQDRSRRQQPAPTQRHAHRKSPVEQPGTAKHSEPQHQSHRHAKANCKKPTAPAKCGGRTSPSLFNNRYL